jgi:hypothetical protein
MWTIVRFALLREGDYRAALDLLAQHGLQPLRAPPRRDRGAYPAAVVAHLSADPAAISRAVFERLAAAGVAPLAVMACAADVADAANSPRALAQA